MKTLYFINQDQNVEEISKQIAEDRQKQSQDDIALIKAHPLFFVSDNLNLKNQTKDLRKGNIYIVAGSKPLETEFHIVNHKNELVEIKSVDLWRKYKGTLNAVNVQRNGRGLEFIKDALEACQNNIEEETLSSDMPSSKGTETKPNTSSQKTELSQFQLNMIQSVEQKEYYLAVAIDNNNHDFYRVDKNNQQIKILTIPTSLSDIERLSKDSISNDKFKTITVKDGFLNNLQNNYTCKYSESVRDIFKKEKCSSVLAIAEQLNENLDKRIASS